MNIGRLAWNTPTGGILWEFWGRHKRAFPWHALTLLTSMGLVYWMEHETQKDLQSLLLLGSLVCFLGAFLHLLACFGYIEADSRTVRVGFPARLLLKPVSATRLALVPMVCGGAVVVGVFCVWTETVIRHLTPMSDSTLLWVSGVLLSFFWWMQALSWSLPIFPGKMIVHLLVAVIHLLVGILPLGPVNSLTSWQWPILFILLSTAPALAVLGLHHIRHGGLESPSRPRMPRTGQRPKQPYVPCQKFASALHAQFWLEWRQQGRLLPGVCAGIIFLHIPFIFALQRSLGDSWLGGEAELVAVPVLVLLIPLLLSGIMAPVLARFDPLDPIGELPLYIAVRPMTSGGFVAAKLAMALASSLLTWFLVIVAAVFWIALLGKGILFSKIASVIHGPVSAVKVLPLLSLPVLLTWKNLIAGIAASLSGRRWILMLFTFLRVSVSMGIGALVFKARLEEGFQEALIRWVPTLVITCLTLKIVITITAFAFGLRQNAINARSVVCIAASWLFSGILLSCYANTACLSAGRPAFWIWAALACLLVPPLADLAIAPLALSWNRHR